MLITTEKSMEKLVDAKIIRKSFKDKLECKVLPYLKSKKRKSRGEKL